MELKEFAKLLEETGLPVAFYHFPNDEPHDPPFLCYITLGSSQFSADGKVYHSGNNVQVELYTVEKDIEAEKMVESALEDYFFLKDEGRIDEEEMYMVTYQLSL